MSTLDEREALDLLPSEADENAADGRLIVAVVVTEVIVGFLLPTQGPPGVLHLDLRHFKGNSVTRFGARDIKMWYVWERKSFANIICP